MNDFIAIENTQMTAIAAFEHERETNTLRLMKPLKILSKLLVWALPMRKTKKHFANITTR
jgi:hypothetical protein